MNEPKKIHFAEAILLIGLCTVALLVTRHFQFNAKILKIKNFMEAETLRVTDKSSDFEFVYQATNDFLDGSWSNNGHMFAQAKKSPAWIELAIPIPEDGKYKLLGYFSKSYDYATIQILHNLKPLSAPIDLWSSSITNSGPIDLGVFNLKKSELILRIQTTARNQNAQTENYLFGIDGFSLSKE